MSRPIKKQSHSGATSAAAGTGHGLKGHINVGLWVVASNLDTANDTLDVRLEAGTEDDKAGDSEWAVIRDPSGTAIGSLSVADFDDIDGDGTYTAFLKIRSVTTPRLRANITSFTDAAGSDLTVDTYVTGAGNSDTGFGYEK